MDPLFYILIFLVLWLIVIDVVAAFIIALCSLLGRSHEPAAVPNKSVWG